MFTFDILAIKLLSLLYEKIYPWPDSLYYGAGGYAKFIISLFVFQQCFSIVYAYKVKKAKKKEGDSKCL